MRNVKSIIKNFIGFMVVFLAILIWLPTIVKNVSDFFIAKEKVIIMDKETSSQHCIMTVFVHGTILKYVSPVTLMQVLKENKEYTSEQKGLLSSYKESLRSSGLYRLQPIQKKGFVPIVPVSDIEKKNKFYISSFTADLFRDVIHLAGNKEETDKKYFYTFGWSGHLNFESRYKASEVLYDGIIKERDRLIKETGLPVKIRIFAHSHGGNVALHLAELEDKYNKNLALNQLVLLGTPIQSETERLIFHPIFNKIYNIYSLGDHVQVADIISTKDFFSRREFGGEKSVLKTLPSNLSQIEVQVGSYHPFHAELWLFGIVKSPNFFYRKKLDIYPLPILVFAPVVTELADSVLERSGNIKVNIKKVGKLCGFTVSSKDKKKPFASLTKEFDISGLKDRAFKLLE